RDSYQSRQPFSASRLRVSTVMSSAGARRQPHPRVTGRRRAVALVLGPDVEVDEVAPVLLPDARDARLQPRRVADQDRLTQLHVLVLDPAVVADPVEEQVAEPRHALGAVVERGRDADVLRQLVLPVDALRDVGDAARVGRERPRMLLAVLV